ncbi:hypothetical protein [Paraburkholderia sp. GAS334]|uniref:hypothetical protein n=1 Tax=Paraburkholderia sp. GAS334 TaxID=3035131 RepID=UPI003D1A5611
MVKLTVMKLTRSALLVLFRRRGHAKLDRRVHEKMLLALSKFSGATIALPIGAFTRRKGLSRFLANTDCKHAADGPKAEKIDEPRRPNVRSRQKQTAHLQVSTLARIEATRYRIAERYITYRTWHAEPWLGAREMLEPKFVVAAFAVAKRLQTQPT